MLNLWFFAGDDGVREMFMVGEGDEVGKVRCAVVAKNELVLFVLIVIAII